MSRLGRLQPGQCVRIDGLSQTDLNGSKGHVIQWVASKERFSIRLSSGREILVRPVHLTTITEKKLMPFSLAIIELAAAFINALSAYASNVEQQPLTMLALREGTYNHLVRAMAEPECSGELLWLPSPLRVLMFELKRTFYGWLQGHCNTDDWSPDSSDICNAWTDHALLMWLQECLQNDPTG